MAKAKRSDDDEPIEQIKRVRKPGTELFIMSGGQDGVDTGAIDAARTLGLPWGARLPEDYLRASPMPKWMEEAKGDRVTEYKGVTKYNERTDRVVQSNTACLVINPDGDFTPGTALTLKLTERHGVPTWRFMSVADKAAWKAECHAIAYWLRSLVYLQGQTSLMVAGPREAKWKGAEVTAFALVTATLHAYKDDRSPNQRT